MSMGRCGPYHLSFAFFLLPPGQAHAQVPPESGAGRMRHGTRGAEGGMEDKKEYASETRPHSYDHIWRIRRPQPLKK